MTNCHFSHYRKHLIVSHLSIFTSHSELRKCAEVNSTTRQICTSFTICFGRLESFSVEFVSSESGLSFLLFHTLCRVAQGSTDTCLPLFDEGWIEGWRAFTLSPQDAHVLIKCQYFSLSHRRLEGGNHGKVERGGECKYSIPLERFVSSTALL